MKIFVVRICEHIGGAEIYNLNLIKGLNKYFHEVELFYITTLPRFERKIEKLRAKVFLLPVFNKEIGTKRDLLGLFFSLPKYLFYFLKTFFNLNSKEKIDLVLFQGMTEKVILTPILRVLGFKVLWLEHGPVFTFPKAKLVLSLYKLLAKFTNKIVTASYDARKDLVKNGIKPQKIISVSTGIDTEYFFPFSKNEIYKIKKALRITKNEKIIGYTGAISKVKGINDFLKVADFLCHKLKNVKFFLVGSGPDLDKAKRKINKKRFGENFIFTGFQEDVKPYLGIFDLFFFPTRHFEASSLSILEAMAMGVPVVTRDIGGNRELVVHGKTGYLYKNETPEELADLIIKLLKNPKKRKKIGIEARKRIVKHFNLKRWVTDLYQVFKEVAGNNVHN